MSLQASLFAVTIVNSSIFVPLKHHNKVKKYCMSRKNNKNILKLKKHFEHSNTGSGLQNVLLYLQFITIIVLQLES